MKLANAPFFLEGTAGRWYDINEEGIDSWDMLKEMFSRTFDNSGVLLRRAKDNLQNRVQKSRESCEFYIQDVLSLCRQVNPDMTKEEKVAHLMKGVVEDVYQVILVKEIDTVEAFVDWCRKVDACKQRRIGKPKFKRLLNVANARVTSPGTAESGEGWWIDSHWGDTTLSRTARERSIIAMKPQAAQVIEASRPIQVVADPQLNVAPRYRQADDLADHLIVRKTRASALRWSDAGMTLRVADGKYIVSRGRCTLRLEMNGLVQPFEFVVLPSFSHDIILGWDFLEASRAIIDCGRAEILLEKEELPVDSSSIFQTVAADDSFTIPAGSTKQINVIREAILGVGDVVMKPSRILFLERNLMVPPSIFAVQHGKGRLWITNIGTCDRTVPKGMCIGDIQVLEEGHLAVIGDASDTNPQGILGQENSPNIASMISPDLSMFERTRICSLLGSFSGLFEFNKFPSNLTSTTKHKINTEDHPPIKRRPYRVSQVERQIIQNEVDKMLKGGIVQLSESPWSSPVIEVDEADREKTTFITTDGLYEFKVMPFGLCNAPAIFERMMDNLLRDKCLFGTKRLSIFGHLVDGEGVHPDPDKVDAMSKCPTPKSLTDVRSVIGMCSYYRRFIKDFAQRAEPLHRLLRKDTRFEWGPDQRQAYESLKLALASEPVLANFDVKYAAELHTDASGFGIGAVLVQVQGGSLKDLSERLARWALRLQEYNVNVVYKNGRKHQDADCLSRNPIEANNPGESEDDISTLASLTDIVAEQRKDPTHSINHSSSSSQILLSTALIRVNDLYGNSCMARALVDTGSQRTLITDLLRKTLNLPVNYLDASMYGIGVGGLTWLALGWRIQPLTSPLPLILSLELIFPPSLYAGQVMFQNERGPTACNSKLGRLLSGKIMAQQSDGSLHHSVLIVCATSIDNQLRKFWELDSIPPCTQPILTKKEIYCEQHFKANVLRTTTGRYQIIALLAEGGFPFRKWVPNSPKMLDFLLKDQKGINQSFDFMDLLSVKLLGISWVPSLDSFTIRVKPPDTQSLSLHFDQIFLCSDSTIALNCIKSESKRWKIFVANRVSAIQRKKPSHSWFHVPGSENPVDLATRGLTPAQLIDNQLWWQGLHCLQEPSVNSYIDLPPSDELSPETLIEERSTILVYHSIVGPMPELLLKYSSWIKTVDIMAFCLRFISNCKSTNKSLKRFLSGSEIHNAMVKIIILIKNQEFTQDIGWLRNKGSVLEKSNLRFLNPFLDGDGILRVVIQIMGELPPERVMPSRPFQQVGVDWAGPIITKPMLKRSEKILKTYIVLFICFTTKAIHLEVVSDLTAEALIATLRRFTSRRGLPSDIFSDNATNFKLANRVLLDFYRKLNIQNFGAQRGIRWHFIPPSALHFGGLWEAARPRWHKTHQDLQSGQLVLMKQDSTPPHHWPLARIIKTYKGPDGHVRVVDLKTPKNVFKRPITKIAPLPFKE
ncbi:hypothetical protein LAZ67_14001432 [Cordylochernes scorpioides]|uniref:Integrase catalytic domain-containing protein n=1 Tax=Cordylochernes scorpioides TaxID=51811 RepID=A0ABY6L655_9ARAC|nr:hypothetical protein LAZ67_14001432 [Cordylochernes scorpioides]